MRIVSKYFIFLSCVLLFVTATQVTRADDISSAHYKILSPTIAPGGYSTSANYKSYGTAGEVAHGTSTSSHFGVNLGFFSFPFVSVPVLSAQTGNVSGRVDLSWTASIPYVGYTVSGYQIGSSTTSGGPYNYMAVGPVLIYNATSLINGTPYYFVIRALDTNSLPIATSSEVSATPTAPSLTFVIDSGTQNLPSITPGTLVATSSILTVKTTNPSGFVVTLARSNNAATLLLSTDSSTTISDKTDWMAPAATTTTGNTTASTTQTQTLQFRLWKAVTDPQDYSTIWWGSDDSSANALFAGIPSTTQTIVNSSISAPATTTMRVLYDLSVPTTQKTGTYNGNIVYTVTANP
jgi:hypothetical protein